MKWRISTGRTSEYKRKLNKLIFFQKKGLRKSCKNHKIVFFYEVYIKNTSFKNKCVSRQMIYGPTLV